MTSQEARRQVEDCEREIVSAYDDMRSAARTVGTTAVSEAASGTAANLFWILSVFGFVLACVSFIFRSHLMLWGGIILLGAGVYYALTISTNSKKVQVQIESQQKDLNSTLDYHSKI